MRASVKTFLNNMGKLFINKSFLFLVNGFLLASLFYFYSEDRYERQLFKSIASKISEKLPAGKAAEDSILARSLNITHRLLKRRTATFGETDFSGLKADLIQPVTFDLMTGKGACGSNAYVLGRLLQNFGMPVRFPQMKVKGIYGGHILLEAKTSDGWKVFDPLYNLAFRRPDGKLASFNEVHSSWNYYRQQVPEGYDMSYAYDDARYTNWGKIPVVMPLIRNILYLVKGKEATDVYSLRTLFLKKYSVAFNIILVIYIALCIFMLRLFRKKKRVVVTKQEEKIQTKQPLLVEVYN